MVVNKSPFESKYGFRGPGFSVDAEGNIIANSITVAEDDTASVETPADYVISETTGDFVFSNVVGTNPTNITLSRGSRYIFDLSLTTINFVLYSEDKVTYLSSGLSHSDGTIGINAQEKQTGRLIFNVSNSLPDIIYYGTTTNPTEFYPITITDPDGTFNTVSINSAIDTNGIGVGALQVAGGVSVEKNLFVNKNIIASELVSNSNLILASQDGIVVLGSDSSVIGTIENSGSTIPLLNTTITNSTASFTSASVATYPTTGNDIANKTYVDGQITALAIALGI